VPASAEPISGGLCNTRLSATSGTTREAGCDTWRLLFKSADRLPPTGGKLGHYDVISIPAYAMFVLDGHPAPGKLASGDELGEALEEAISVARSEVGPTTTFEGPSRVDSTATHLFDDAARGLAVLSGVAAVADLLPGVKQEVIGRPAETVYLISKRGRGAKLARAYDAMAMHPELATAPGQAIRFEDQLKLRKGRRPDAVDVVDPAYYRRKWHDRFVPLWRASKGVRVVGAAELPKRLGELVNDGEMTIQQAERAGGFLAIEAAGLADRYKRESRRTYFRRRQELLTHGLVLADNFHDPVEVDLSEVLASVLDSPAWGAYG
jgi:hypothetical protein